MTVNRLLPACIVVAVLLIPLALEAQRRGLMGRVTDTSGAALPGVTVELVRDGKTERTETSMRPRCSCCVASRSLP